MSNTPLNSLGYARVLLHSFTSLAIRAVFVIANAAGACWLVWGIQECRKGHFTEDEMNLKVASIALPLVVMGVGSLGAFRRGNREANFSFAAAALIAAGAAAGFSVHPHSMKFQGSLVRFPRFESLVLGGALIAAWLMTWIVLEENWMLRTGAGVGAVQVVWGLLVARQRQAEKTEWSRAAVLDGRVRGNDAHNFRPTWRN